MELTAAYVAGHVDRRRDPRIQYHDSITLQRLDGSGRCYACVCTDISSNGLGVELRSSGHGGLAVGELVEVHLENTVGEISRYRGRVVFHRDTTHYGLELEPLG